MSQPIISICNLGKRYQLGITHEDILANRILSGIKGVFRARRSVTKEPKEIWALTNVSLDVCEGEIIGIIGHNGAGKSTLLKILSRITSPSTGEIVMKGRVGSLLEVGTGFHPELTGRENIFLNGAILGMSRKEVNAKFDEIVEFAGVGKFLDTPVKRYSSGMYVRLAFAVAAHLDPEILVIDEVLAVGDASFQRKCLEKMETIARGGRTVLFVSHNMQMVENLCSRAYVLDQGTIGYMGSSTNAVAHYVNQQLAGSSHDIDQRADRRGSGEVRISGFEIESMDSEMPNHIRSGDRLRIEIRYEGEEARRNIRFVVGIYDAMNTPLLRFDSDLGGGFDINVRQAGIVVCETAPLPLSAGPCYVNVAVCLGTQVVDHVVAATKFDVLPSDFFGSGRTIDRKDSLFLLPHTWSSIR